LQTSKILSDSDSEIIYFYNDLLRVKALNSIVIFRPAILQLILEIVPSYIEKVQLLQCGLFDVKQLSNPNHSQHPKAYVDGYCTNHCSSALVILLQVKNKIIA